jgi:type I restriction enzyme S subunit
MKALGEICEMIKRGSQPKYTESADGEIVLNQKCIRDHKINLSVARKHDTSKKTINKERYIQLGDGLINSTGTGTLGRVAQVRELNFSAFVDTHITIVRPKKEVFYLDFFGWALIYIEKIIQKSGEGASGQTELSRKVVEKLIISYPNEMKQQKKIVQKLDSLSVECKKIEAIYTQKIADLEEMKKSVLQKAFAGQLNTVN